jgi:phospholipid/cholesterol/gamma-HCH transport system substrate-binding protein
MSAPAGWRRPSAPALGVIFVLVVLVLFVVLFSKDRIGTYMRGGETITVRFAGDYKLREFISEVKTAYVPVGKVSGVDREDDGTAVVTLKVDDDVVDTLGSAPTAAVRATTLLGGIYFVDLQPGGDPGRFTAGEIPLERSRGPVELDQVVQALQPDALAGLQGTIGHLDGTLDEPGTAALRRLTAAAPAALGPAASVLDAAQGHDPADLTATVDGLENAARVLTANDGLLDDIVTDLATTSTVLGNRSSDIGTTIDGLPDTLRTAQAGLTRLDGTLDTLRDTASDIRPVATQLDDTLATLDPVLAEALPLVRDTRALLGDARPLVEQLLPVASGATDVLTDLRGPVLDRLNGPVTDLLHTPYVGSGPYDATRSERPLYWDVVYAMVNLGRSSAYEDENGGVLAFQPGIGAGSVSGLPISPDQTLQILLGGTYAEQPIDTLPPADRQPPGTGLLGQLGDN